MSTASQEEREEPEECGQHEEDDAHGVGGDGEDEPERVWVRFLRFCWRFCPNI